MSDDMKASFAAVRKCAVTNCGRNREWPSGLCGYHRTLQTAKRLTAGDLESLRSELAGMTVLSENERAQERKAFYLEDLERQIRWVAEAEKKAREYGATEREIAALKGVDEALARIAGQQTQAEAITEAFKAALGAIHITGEQRDQAIWTFLEQFPRDDH